MQTLLNLYVLWLLQESGVKANQPCSFVIQLNGAKGHLKAKAYSPSGVECECVITEIDEGEAEISAC